MVSQFMDYFLVLAIVYVLLHYCAIDLETLIVIRPAHDMTFSLLQESQFNNQLIDVGFLRQ